MKTVSIEKAKNICTQKISFCNILKKFPTRFNEDRREYEDIKDMYYAILNCINEGKEVEESLELVSSSLNYSLTNQIERLSLLEIDTPILGSNIRTINQLKEQIERSKKNLSTFEEMKKEYYDLESKVYHLIV